MNRQISKLGLQMASIRRESDIQLLRTDIRHLQVKARSLQRQTSSVIEEVSKSMFTRTYFKLYFIRFVCLSMLLWKVNSC